MSLLHQIWTLICTKYNREDDTRSQRGNSFDEKDEDSDISRDGNDPPYCPDVETESDTSSCETNDSDKFHSLNVSTVKEPKLLVLVFLGGTCCPY